VNAMERVKERMASRVRGETVDYDTECVEDDTKLLALAEAAAAKLDAGSAAMRLVARRHGATTAELNLAVARGMA